MEEKNDKVLSDIQKNVIFSTISKGQEKIFNEISKSITSIYMDIEFVQDFRLGALLQLISSQEEYNYIYSKIEDYSTSMDDNTMKHFPLLKITNEQIDAYLKDPEHWFQISLESPFYVNLTEFTNLLALIVQQNIASKEKKSIEIFIGSSTMKYPKMSQVSFVNLFIKVFDNLLFHFLPDSLYEFQDRPIDSYDIYLVRSPSKFLGHPSLVKRFSDMELTDRIVVGMIEMKATDEDLKAFSSTKEQSIESTVEAANIFTHFAFTSRAIQA